MSAAILLLQSCKHASRKTSRSLYRELSSITGNRKTDIVIDTLTLGRAERWLKKYEDFIGLTEVREAQRNVIEFEKDFLESQTVRRERQAELSKVQSQLRDIGSKLDKVQRGDERYLQLLTEEHKIIKAENDLTKRLEADEKLERHLFANLSSAVRESHEKERTRTERTKYWSIIGSCVGALIGILGTTINNYLRMRQLRELISDSTQDGAELRKVVSSLSTAINTEHENMNKFVGDLKEAIGSEDKPALLLSNQFDFKDREKLEAQTQRILSAVKMEEDELKRHMEEIKSALAIGHKGEGSVVYVGPDLQEILDENEKKIEVQMKVNALWTVTAIYGAVMLTAPLLFYFLKNS
ncbi:DgyrCDS4742 [Dimorphilus gyrociliatus]|uniref:DgyrCDS4742 n=1 Tax=Dimorphilus gyrociliatus TaxID=2664684 RepID=A0A7I8VHH7_9ANNE|nr:DgyrCDS4742 [Dimorphilus gyrociliatus]